MARYVLADEVAMNGCRQNAPVRDSGQRTIHSRRIGRMPVGCRTGLGRVLGLTLWGVVAIGCDGSGDDPNVEGDAGDGMAAIGPDEAQPAVKGTRTASTESTPEDEGEERSRVVDDAGLQSSNDGSSAEAERSSDDGKAPSLDDAGNVLHFTMDTRLPRGRRSKCVALFKCQRGGCF